MDIIISALAAMGIPVVIFHAIMCASGLCGHVSSLSPGGMIIGVILLLAIQVVSFLLTKSTIEWIYDQVIRRLIKDGCPDEDIIKTISKYHVTRALKMRLVHKLAVQSAIKIIRNEIELSKASKESMIQRDID